MNIIPIARPPWTGVGRKIESMCRKALFSFDLLEGKKKIGIALSGGKDSLTLLFMLKAMSGRGIPELDITALHVDGEFSCGAGLTKGFLREICRELDVPLVIKSSPQKREKLECYSCSRERRRLLFEGATEAGIDRIAFGHHREDAIQTLLLNLLHKAEFAGNLPKVPMHCVGITIIRPLLFVPEEEIRSFASQHGFARIVCQCPVGQDSKRKKTANLIEVLEREFPNARANLLQAALEYGSTKALSQ